MGTRKDPSRKRKADSELENTPKRGKERQGSVVVTVNDEYADVQLTCEGKRWKLHRALLCQRSPWFKTALNGRFIEANGNIDIEEWSSGDIDQLITYLYEQRCVTPGNYDFNDLIKCWQLGDYFLIPIMCETALKELDKLLKSAARILIEKLPASSSTRPNDTTAAPLPSEDEKIIMQILTHFRTALAYAYENQTSKASAATLPAPTTAVTQTLSMPLGEDNPIRPPLVSFYSQGAIRYHHNPRWEIGPYIEKEIPKFAADVLHYITSGEGSVKLMELCQTCKSCKINYFRSNGGVFSRANMRMECLECPGYY
ncbi:hypothetical protein F4804DRAFT_314710 [Jackrogersella minutella]|nr:hypothetical protein F4804DRAFT_314710 [Jackrogersella minutella]